MAKKIPAKSKKSKTAIKAKVKKSQVVKAKVKKAKTTKTAKPNSKPKRPPAPWMPSPPKDLPSASNGPSADTDLQKPKLRSDDNDNETYDWVTAIVDCDHVNMDYQCTGLEVQGHDGFSDDNIGDWSEDDIRNMVCSILGINKADAHLIEVGYA